MDNCRPGRQNLFKANPHGQQWDWWVEARPAQHGASPSEGGTKHIPSLQPTEQELKPSLPLKRERPHLLNAVSIPNWINGQPCKFPLELQRTFQIEEEFSPQVTGMLQLRGCCCFADEAQEINRIHPILLKPFVSAENWKHGWKQMGKIKAWLENQQNSAVLTEETLLQSPSIFCVSLPYKNIGTAANHPVGENSESLGEKRRRKFIQNNLNILQSQTEVSKTPQKSLNLGNIPKTHLENKWNQAALSEQALQSNWSQTQHYFCRGGLIIDLLYEYFCGADGAWLVASDPLPAPRASRKNL